MSVRNAITLLIEQAVEQRHKVASLHTSATRLTVADMGAWWGDNLAEGRKPVLPASHPCTLAIFAPLMMLFASQRTTRLPHLQGLYSLERGILTSCGFP
jgi:hypothetical protein